MLIDPTKVTNIVEDAAQEEILPRFRALADEDVRRKKSGELVTVADEAAELAIAARLKELLPGSVDCGEEAVAADPRRLNALTGEDYVWLIDPIDGTSNFARNKPRFAVMVALVRSGQILAGWIHDPIAGDTAVAMAGEGAERAGRRLKLSGKSDPNDLKGTLHAGQFSTPEMRRHIETRRGRLNTLESLRSAGQEYLRLAIGESDFALFTKLMPWDHAPGVLIVREAGGVGLTLDGVDYRPVMHRSPALLLAPDRAAWDWLNETLFGQADPAQLTAWQGNFAQQG